MDNLSSPPSLSLPLSFSVYITLSLSPSLSLYHSLPPFLSLSYHTHTSIDQRVSLSLISHTPLYRPTAPPPPPITPAHLYASVSLSHIQPPPTSIDQRVSLSLISHT